MNEIRIFAKLADEARQNPRTCGFHLASAAPRLLFVYRLRRALMGMPVSAWSFCFFRLFGYHSFGGQ